MFNKISSPGNVRLELCKSLLDRSKTGVLICLLSWMSYSMVFRENKWYNRLYSFMQRTIFGCIISIINILYVTAIAIKLLLLSNVCFSSFGFGSDNIQFYCLFCWGFQKLILTVLTCNQLKFYASGTLNPS